MRTWFCLSVILGMIISVTCRAESPCPLLKRIGSFTRGSESSLAALVRFGSENHISFGIESLASDPRPPINTIPTETTAQAAILKIIGAPQHYPLSCVNDVVLIRDDRVPTPMWLSRRIPTFRTPRVSLKLASAALGDQLGSLLNPRQQGYAGSILDSIPPNLVGPFEIKAAPVRYILCRLIAGSKGAVWVVPPTGESFADSATVDTFWTIILYPIGN